jgi:positive regulator of sigma E activity
MLIKYISFLIGIIWSYSIIKTQSIFSKKAGIIFKIFITKVSWFTFVAACYFGYKNFTIKSVIIGIVIGILLVNIGFYFLKKYINQKFKEKQIIIFKSFFEYTLIFLVIYFVLF